MLVSEPLMAGNTSDVEKIRFIIARKSIPPGQITLYKALYEAGEQGLLKAELAKIIRDGDEDSLAGLLGGLGTRVNMTEGYKKGPGIGMLLEYERINGEWRYWMRPELRAAIDSLPRLQAELKLSVEEIYEKYQDERQWLRLDEVCLDTFALPEEIDTPQVFYEGATKVVSVNAYERNSEARRQCIARYGPKCFICGFNFADTYGEVGEGLIHVHHIKPLAEIGEEYEVDPIRDLCPVCPNCHAIIHRRKPAYTVEEVKAFLELAGR